MNYQKIHDQIIDRAKDRVLSGYTERHHIIPKCMGGNNNKENLVFLTAQEHFIIHKLLHFIHPNHNKLFYAYKQMATQTNSIKNKRTYTVGPKEFERLRIEHARRISEDRMGIVFSKQHRENISKSLTGRTIPRNVRKKIGEASKLRNHSIESKQKISLTHKGKPKSAEHKQKLREAALGTNTGQKETIACPYCNKIGGKPIMIRWHFDNCKKFNIIK